MKKLLLCSAAALLLVTGCSSSPSSEAKGDNTGGSSTTPAQSTAPAESTAPTETAPAETDGITVTFKVTTSTKAKVMWGTTSGTSQADIKKGNWSKNLKLDDFDASSVIVTSADFTKSANVSCEILINGVSKSKNSAKGKLASASCAANTLS